MLASAGYVSPTREAMITKALRDEYPNKLSAMQIMNRAGLSWRTDPARSFTLLCISFSSVRRSLSGSGWQAMRSGGTPDDHYWLSKDG
jgi:hypothetical protein